MQIECYSRNWATDVCSEKCKFHYECWRESVKNLKVESDGEELPDELAALIELRNEIEKKLKVFTNSEHSAL